jgi:AcrR family transcriptional regulator
MSEIKKPKRHSPLSHAQSKPISSSIRERVLEAAFTLFREHGFSSTSMLDIVTRAPRYKKPLGSDYRARESAARQDRRLHPN